MTPVNNPVSKKCIDRKPQCFSFNNYCTLKIRNNIWWNHRKRIKKYDYKLSTWSWQNSRVYPLQNKYLGEIFHLKIHKSWKNLKIQNSKFCKFIKDIWRNVIVNFGCDCNIIPVVIGPKINILTKILNNF